MTDIEKRHYASENPAGSGEMEPSGSVVESAREFSELVHASGAFSYFAMVGEAVPGGLAGSLSHLFLVYRSIDDNQEVLSRTGNIFSELARLLSVRFDVSVHLFPDSELSGPELQLSLHRLCRRSQRHRLRIDEILPPLEGRQPT